jgi:hypothetical protein
MSRRLAFDDLFYCSVITAEYVQADRMKNGTRSK